MRDIHHSFLPNKSQITSSNASHLPNIPFPFVKQGIRNHTISTGSTSTILIVGSMSYEPNYLGVDHFISDIWSKIRDEVPEAILNIAGRNLPERYQKKFEAVKDVNYLGFVPDITEAYANCQVVAAPIYS